VSFAFLLMGNFDSQKDRAVLEGKDVQVIGVADLQQACAVAKELYGQGIGCIELCGAFGETGAKAVIEATENQVPVGFVTHFPQQDELFAKAFPNG
jgi:2-keto-3-deoxy-6-phosphogluconate aldolase